MYKSDSGLVAWECEASAELLPVISPVESGRDRLLAIARLGIMPTDIMAAMIDVFYPKLLNTEELRYLAGPVVVHASPWAQDIPKWLIEAAKTERLRVVLEQRMIVGPAELTAVMMPATYDAPLPRDMPDLYLWASANAAARHYGKPIEEYWQKLEMRPIADADVIDRQGRLWDAYRSLAETVRSRVVGHSQLRRQRREDSPDAAEAKAVAAPVGETIVQLSMF